jgi:drug/metabolite transporter (DMT)-like permease
MISQSTTGILILIMATFFLAMMDGVSRYLAEQYNVVIINMLRFWILGSVVVILSLRSKSVFKSITKTSHPFLQMMRGLLFISSIIVAIYSYTQIGLVLTHSILAFSPLLAVLLSGVILKEKIGVSKWIAVLIGFTGVIIILNPISLTLNLFLFLPLPAAVTLAFYAVLTRKVAANDNTETSFFWVTIVSAIVITLPGSLYYQPLAYTDFYWLIVLCFFSLVGHFLLTKAYQYAEASFLQPFIYFHLLFASIIGIVFFGDSMTGSNILGGLFIVLSGVFVSKQV